MSPNRPLVRGVLVRGNVGLEEMIGDVLAEAVIEPPIVTEPRQNDFRKQEKGHDLHEHQHRGLQSNIGSAPPPDPHDAEEDDAKAVE